MKKYLICAVFSLVLAACKNQPAPEVKALNLALVPPPKADFVPPPARMVKFPSPVVEKEINTIGSANENAIAESPSAEKPVVADTAKKIIKTGDVHFESKDLAATRKALMLSLKQSGGFAEEDNETLDSSADEKVYNIKARIPARNFDQFFEKATATAIKIDSRHTNISDVTATYIDMATRLRNQKILEGTYVNLLKNASKMRDVLDIEDNLTDTRTEIESEQGQLNYLTRQIAYSTLDITFYTKQIQHETGTGAGYKLFSSISDGWKLLQSAFFGLISVWPLTLVAVFTAIFVRKWAKNRKIILRKPKASA